MDLLALVQPLLTPAFSLLDAPVTWLELIAFVMAIVMVLLNMRVNPWAWPLAIGSSVLYGLLFWDSKLYGEASLQVLFVVVAGWGWWQWLRGRQADGDLLRVRPLARRTLLLALAAMAIGWPAIALFLKAWTDSTAPWWDAFPTAASVIGQWLLGRKYIENWPAWVVVNVASVALFAYKGLWLTTLLYAIFVVMSFAGWRAWRQLAVAR